jgi:hypothetical protein
MRTNRVYTLQPAVTKAANYSQAPKDIKAAKASELVITLKVTAAERDTGDETYDVHVITENDAGAKWDLVHFPQVAATGAKTFVARLRSDLLPQSVTTAAPGVSAVESGTIAVATGQTNVIKSLAAGTVRHGPWGDKIGHELVVAGAVATGIAYSISVEAR